MGNDNNSDVIFPDEVKNTGSTAGQGSAPAQPKGAAELNLLAALSGTLDTPCHLSETGNAYSTRIKEILKESFATCAFHRITASNYEAHVFYAQGFGVGLIFEESYTATDATPPACAKADLVTRCSTVLAGVTLLETIVVRKEEYDRAGQMASFIKNTIISSANGHLSTMSLEAFGGTEYLVTADMQRVRSFIQQRSPHAVPARDDIGVLLYAKAPKADAPQSTFNPRDRYNLVPVMAITGYTQFFLQAPVTTMAPGGMAFGQPKFMPMTIVTDIVADLRNPQMMAIGLALAVDAFIIRYGWLNQFNSYTENEPNIGRLINDPKTNRPWVAKNVAQRDDFLQKYLTSPTPLLAIDVQEGRARIPSLSYLIRNHEQLLAALSKFTGQDFGKMDPVVGRYPQFDGQVVLGSTQTVDSRCIDFLRMAVDIPNTDDLARFLLQLTDIRAGLEEVRRLFPNTTVGLYATMRCVLQPAFVTMVASGLQSRIRIEYDFNNQQSAYNLQQIATANNFLGFTGFQQNAGAVTWNGGNNWW
jgi:hypothetical protein